MFSFIMMGFKKKNNTAGAEIFQADLTYSKHPSGRHWKLKGIKFNPTVIPIFIYVYR